MAFEIKERFSVAAPIDAVWQFVMDPEQVVTCMPGATLDEVVDDRTFLGSVKVKLGAITTSYRGRVQLAEVDEAGRAVRMIAEGRETGGGTARGSLSSSLRALPDGQTEVVVEAKIDLTGRVVQVGRGMIQGVSHQLFQQFAASTQERLALPGGTPREILPTPPIRIVPLLFQTVRAAILRFVGRLLGRPDQER